MISVNVHANQNGLRIGIVYPENNGQVTLEDFEGKERITLFLPEPQWIALIEVLPVSHAFCVAVAENKFLRGKQAFDFLRATYGVSLKQAA